MTEFSQVDCMDFMSRQCSGFQKRDTSFWLRQSTVPADRQVSASASFSRQLSCPSGTKLETIIAGRSRMPDIPCSDVSSKEHTPLASRQVSLEPEVTIDEGLIEAVVCGVVTECGFAVSAAEPTSMDLELIAVSDSFCKMTGYNREDVIGENCRFLNEGCPLSLEQRSNIRSAANSGTYFSDVIVNRKKDGEPFLNLVDIRGLVIARNSRTDEDLWISLAAQMDVTGKKPHDIPGSNMDLLNHVAGRIRKRLISKISELGIGGALLKFKVQRKVHSANSSDNQRVDDDGSWQLVLGTMWKPGGGDTHASSCCNRELPDLTEFHGRLPPLVGISHRVNTLNDVPAFRNISSPPPSVERTVLGNGAEANATDVFGTKVQTVSTWLVVGLASALGSLLVLRAWGQARRV
eukprot:TRINITY_DN13026_c0_g1_i1.p1 TRINITY_DN13026_c0_g1~~TRINITY_DN13026_c0_g1_i1.p1  ORF type:complete len:468 (-),score=53.00 TRINITY_DN13026_c0_g1_i1:133-1350(-)